MSDEIRSALIVLGYGLTSSIDERSQVIGGLLNLLDKVNALEEKVASLEKQLSSQGASIQDLGTRTAGLQVLGSPYPLDYNDGRVRNSK